MGPKNSVWYGPSFPRPAKHKGQGCAVTVVPSWLFLRVLATMADQRIRSHALAELSRTCIRFGDNSLTEVVREFPPWPNRRAIASHQTALPRSLSFFFLLLFFYFFFSFFFSLFSFYSFFSFHYSSVNNYLSSSESVPHRSLAALSQVSTSPRDWFPKRIQRKHFAHKKNRTFEGAYPVLSMQKCALFSGLSFRHSFFFLLFSSLFSSFDIFPFSSFFVFFSFLGRSKSDFLSTIASRFLYAFL